MCLAASDAGGSSSSRCFRNRRCTCFTAFGSTGDASTEGCLACFLQRKKKRSASTVCARNSGVSLLFATARQGKLSVLHDDADARSETCQRPPKASSCLEKKIGGSVRRNGIACQTEPLLRRTSGILGCWVHGCIRRRVVNKYSNASTMTLRGAQHHPPGHKMTPF